MTQEPLYTVPAAVCVQQNDRTTYTGEDFTLDHGVQAPDILNTGPFILLRVLGVIYLRYTCMCGPSLDSWYVKDSFIFLEEYWSRT